MTISDVEVSIQRVNDWASKEIDKIVYAGTRPVSVCSAVEAATREAAIAWGNLQTHAAQIAEIESIANYVSACMKADLDRAERPAAPSPAVHDGALSVLAEFAPAGRDTAPELVVETF
jgi:hypothetical protein